MPEPALETPPAAPLGLAPRPPATPDTPGESADVVHAPEPRPGRSATAAGRLRVSRLPGVYAPDADSRLLAEALLEEDLRGARVLELCTGSGIIAATAARGGADVTAVDLSRRATLSARATLRLNRVRARVLQGDLLAAVPPGSFDVVAANPPYVPAAGDVPRLRGSTRHWSAGPSGRALLDRICDDAPARLAPGGTLLLVHSEVADLDATVDRLHAAGLEAEVTHERHLPFGPVMRRQTPFLRASGAIAAGQRRERIGVVRAVAPGVRRALAA